MIYFISIVFSSPCLCQFVSCVVTRHVTTSSPHEFYYTIFDAKVSLQHWKHNCRIIQQAGLFSDQPSCFFRLIRLREAPCHGDGCSTDIKLVAEYCYLILLTYNA